MSRPKLLSIFEENTSSTAYSRITNPVVVVKADDHRLEINQYIEIQDKAIITFRAPCSCSSGLEYIKINSDDYILSNLMGTPISSSLSYFKEGTTVSMIIDTKNKKAIILNPALGADWLVSSSSDDGYISNKPPIKKGTHQYSIIMDYSKTDAANTATARGSTALGMGNTASGLYADAGGYGTTASADFSTTRGRGTKATNSGQFAVGKYNDTPITNEIFSVGNGGDDSHRATAFKIVAGTKTSASPNPDIKGFIGDDKIATIPTVEAYHSAAKTYTDQKISPLSSQVSVLKSDVEGHGTRIGTLESNVLAIENQINGEIVDRLNDHGDSISTLEGTVSTHGDSIGTLEETVSTHGNSISDHSTRLSTIESELNTHGDSIGTLEETVSTHEAYISDQGTRLSEVEDAITFTSSDEGKFVTIDSDGHLTAITITVGGSY